MPAASSCRRSVASEPDSRGPLRDSIQDGVERVITAMHARLDAPLPLREMAKIAAMSLFHFSRTFRKRVGVPPCQFLYALRLDEARRQLLTTASDVLEISYNVGYNSLGTFTRRFTDLVGVSPSRLRSLARTPVPDLLDRIEPELLPAHESRGPDLSGTVAAPASFDGLVFVGLFTSPLPQGRPVRCRVLDGAGPFRLAGVPPGRYHLFAAGVPWSEDPKQYLHYDVALRGGGQIVRVAAGDASIVADVTLREAVPSDPPILLAFPAIARPEGSDWRALSAAASSQIA